MTVTKHHGLQNVTFGQRLGVQNVDPHHGWQRQGGWNYGLAAENRRRYHVEPVFTLHQSVDFIAKNLSEL